MTKPITSVVLPCYNSETWIGTTIESVLSQTYHSLEVVVIDDGSTDSSLEIIRTFGDRIAWISGPNRGLPYARNLGVELSHGDYILFLDADDLIASDHIEVLVESLQGRSHHIAVSDWWRLEQCNGKWIHTEVGAKRPPDGDLIRGILNMFLNPAKGWNVPPHAVLWPRKVLVELGGSDVSIPNATEIDLFLRAILNGITPVFVSGGGAYHRSHGPNSRSLSARVSETRAWAVKNILVKLEKQLQEQNRIDDYRVLLAQVYFSHAEYCLVNGLDRELTQECLRHAKSLAGKRAITGTPIGRFFVLAMGLENKHRLAKFMARLGIMRRARREHMRNLQHRSFQKKAAK